MKQKSCQQGLFALPLHPENYLQTIRNDDIDTIPFGYARMSCRWYGDELDKAHRVDMTACIAGRMVMSVHMMSIQIAQAQASSVMACHGEFAQVHHWQEPPCFVNCDSCCAPAQGFPLQSACSSSFSPGVFLRHSLGPRGTCGSPTSPTRDLDHT